MGQDKRVWRCYNGFSMTSPFALTWSYLNILTRERYDALLQVFGNLEEPLKIINEEMLRGLRCREETIRRALIRLEEFDAEKYAVDLTSRGISFLTIGDDAYPKKLKEIGDPPPFLYYKGDLSILDQPCIALVGTRDMSALGKRAAELFTSAAVRAGLVTVSGLALGIDSVVAKETLLAGGKTVAALGHGLGMMYPQSNAKLAAEILKTGGLLLTEFPLDISPDKYTFPARNRIIAGLTLGTIVLEAPKGSGSIITAELALEYNRDVFAVPGPIFDEGYRGCNELIAKGHAKLVSTPEDVFTEIGVIAPEAQKSTYSPESPVEEKILAALTSMPQKVDDLLERSLLDASTVRSTLTMLELAGAVKNFGNGEWIRT